MSRHEGDELAVLDEALVWLTAREQVADARERLASARDPASRVRILHDVAHAVRQEIAILESRDALVVRELLELVDAALSLVAGGVASADRGGHAP